MKLLVLNQLPFDMRVESMAVTDNFPNHKKYAVKVGGEWFVKDADFARRIEDNAALDSES